MIKGWKFIDIYLLLALYEWQQIRDARKRLCQEISMK